MPVAHVATLRNNVNTAGATLAGSSVTVNAGETLFVGIATYRAAGTFTFSSVTWNGLPMTEDKTITIGPGTDIIRTSIFSLYVAAGATAAPQITCSASVDASTIFVMRSSGGATSSIQDGAGASQTGTSANPATGTGSAVNTDDFWVAMIGTDAGAVSNSWTAGSSFTIPTNGAETNGSTNVSSAIEYLANPGSLTAAASATMGGGSATWGAVLMAYKSVSGTGPPPASGDFPQRPEMERPIRAAAFKPMGDGFRTGKFRSWR